MNILLSITFMLGGIMTCMENKALVIVDVQNDFMSWGSLPVEGAENVIPKINELQDQYSHIIITQDWHPENHSSFETTWPVHCVANTKGAECVDELDTHKAQLIVRKGFRQHIDSYSAFYENDHTTTTGLHGYLQQLGITDLDFVGVAYDYCVAWSATDAAKLGYNVTVIKNACASIGSVEEATDKMRQMGIIVNE